MTERDWIGRFREFHGVSAPPSRRRGTKPLAGLLIATACLTAMCWRPAWDGSGAVDRVTSEHRDALSMPPFAVSEPKRKAAVSAVHSIASEAVRLLLEIAVEDSEAGREAAKAVENLREQVGD